MALKAKPSTASGTDQNGVPLAHSQALLKKIRYGNLIEAVSASVNDEGKQVLETISLVCTKEQAFTIKKFINRYSKEYLLERLLCLVAEAK